MRATYVPKKQVKPGDCTVLGIVTETELSPSGKTILITVRSEQDGSLFTDRVSATGNMVVFTQVTP